jgi:hypothetical protein
MPAQVRVTGLRELGQGFKSIERGLGRELSKGLRGVAETVAGAIRSRMPGSAGAGIKARGTQRGAGIAFPGGEATGPQDFIPWLEFGGSTGKGHKVGVPWSGSVQRERIDGGRWIYPTIAAHNDQISEDVAEVLEDLAKKVGFRTHG